MSTSPHCTTSKLLITQFLSNEFTIWHLNYPCSLTFWRRHGLWLPGWIQGEDKCYQSKRQGEIMGKRSRKRMAETRVNHYSLSSSEKVPKFSSHFDQSGKRKEGCQPGKGDSQGESRNWMASTKGSSYNQRVFKCMQQDGESKWITQNSRLERIKILECLVTAAHLPLPKSKFIGTMLSCL